MKPVEVDQEFINSLVESNGWERAGIVVERTQQVEEEEDSEERVDERKKFKKGSKSKTRPGHEDFEAHKGTKSKTHKGKDYMDEETEEEMDALELLEAILEELSDEELLEHAASMLDVFDAAAEQLDLLSEEEDEEEEGEVVEEEYEEDIDEMSPALMRAILKAQRQES